MPEVIVFHYVHSHMISVEKFDKLLDRLHVMVFELRLNDRFDINKEIDRFFYLKAIAELETLHDLLKKRIQNREDIEHILKEKCAEAFDKWRKDVRKLKSNVK